MKCKLVSYLVVILFSQLCLAQTNFDKANELYNKEKYSEAIKIYESILSEGNHSVELYYNLGNSYYKQNQFAWAIYNYEKALLIEPDNSKVKNNLRFAVNMTVDEFKEVPEVGFNKWLQKYTSIYHYDTWAKIAIVFSILVFLSFLGYYLIEKVFVKRIFFTLMVIFLILVPISILISNFEKDQMLKYNPAIVFDEIVNVFEEPKSNSKSISKIHEGSKVYINDISNQYYKVRLINGTEGWILKSTVKAIK